jgi:vacuolar-type H+-ATPase subunit I/STV1
MKLLLHLYPRWWRKRYGAEALDILERRPVTLSLLLDVVVGCVDAWLNQELPSDVSRTYQREDPGGQLMNGNRKRNRLVASVIAGVVLMLITGALVFVETYRTLQGHRDGAPGAINVLAVFAVATAVVGLWVVVTGRRLHNWPGWPFDGRALRLAGAYCLLGSLFVVGLTLTGNEGFAFLIYAGLALTLAATTRVVRTRKPGI